MSAPACSLEPFDLFYGRLVPASAAVYLRWLRPIDGRPPAPDTVCGELTGPFCRFGRTLPATFPLAPATDGSGQTVYGLWSTTIVDPVFWTPDWPARYRWTIRAPGPDNTMHTWQGELGLRPLGVDRGQLRFDGKRYVLRAVTSRSLARTSADPESLDWTALREVKLSYWNEQQPNARSLAEASEFGVLNVLDRSGRSLAEALDEAAAANWRPGAVGIVCLEQEASAPPTRDGLQRNLLWAVVCRDPSIDVPDWASVIVCPAERNVLRAARDRWPDHALIARRPLAKPVPAAEARRACERLQADLAPEFDVAGYVV